MPWIIRPQESSFLSAFAASMRPRRYAVDNLSRQVVIESISLLQ